MFIVILIILAKTIFGGLGQLRVNKEVEKKKKKLERVKAVEMLIIAEDGGQNFFICLHYARIFLFGMQQNAIKLITVERLLWR